MDVWTYHDGELSTLHESDMPPNTITQREQAVDTSQETIWRKSPVSQEMDPFGVRDEMQATIDHLRLQLTRMEGQQVAQLCEQIAKAAEFEKHFKGFFNLPVSYASCRDIAEALEAADAVCQARVAYLGQPKPDHIKATSGHGAKLLERLDETMQGLDNARGV